MTFKTKKQILMLGPDPNSQGGIASVIKTYIDAGWPQRWNGCFMPTSKPNISQFKKLTLAIGTFGHFLQRLLRKEIALVHIHTASFMSFWRKSFFFLTARLFGVPTILHLHGARFMNFCDTCSPLQRMIIRNLLNHVSMIIVLSNWSKDNIQKITNNNNIKVLYNPVIPNTNQTFVVTKDPYQWLFLGELSQRKGIDDLISVAASLVSTVPQLKIYCGGNGDIEALQKKIRANNLEQNLFFPGWLVGDSKAYLLAESSYYILPSYSEVLPVGILEAMASGLPVISTTIAGIPEMITDGKEGFLITPGDLDTLKEKMILLMNDPDLRTEMGEAGKEKIDKVFSIKPIFSQLDKIYRALEECHAST